MGKLSGGLTWVESKPTLFPACVLMCLSGLRIGGCRNVTFDSFRDVAEVQNVKLFEVHNEGSVYDAAISTMVLTYY